ncbi:MAG TPA: Lrp/AsnC ligand binding domain-containing protein [Acidimicrobiales bacterium]|nr:Lrp/AsnC ligand binding domain-containing protein [Acidimicrobiales bacterium]
MHDSPVRPENRLGGRATGVPAAAPAMAPAQHRPPGEQQLRSPSVVHAFVLIEAELAQVADLAEALADVDGVAEVYSVASDDADLVAIIRVRRHEDLAEVVTRRIAALGGIRSTSTMVAFKSYSRHDLEAMWDLGPA